MEDEQNQEGRVEKVDVVEDVVMAAPEARRRRQHQRSQDQQHQNAGDSGHWISIGFPINGRLFFLDFNGFL